MAVVIRRLGADGGDVAADGQGGIWVVDPFNGMMKFQEGATASAPTPASPRPTLEAAPNPFRDRLALRWTQPTAGVARITLEDVSGRRVATLAAGERSAGRQELAWSAAAHGLSTLPAGIYWVRVRAPGNEAARRVAHVR